MRRTPIVVGGPHRSGTSLVRRVLDAHSRVHCGPEVMFFRDLTGDYFTDPLAHLRFPATARQLAGEDDAFEVLGAAFLELHDRAARTHSKARWADKNPDNVLHLNSWDRLLSGDLNLVLVVRNPLDVLASMAEAGFPLTLPPDLTSRTEMWCRYVEAGLTFVDAHAQRSTVLVYEQLVADPSGQVARLMAALGEDFEPQQLAFNEVPHQPGLEDPKVAATTEVHQSSTGRWRSHLSDDQRGQVLARTADVRTRVTAMFADPLPLW